MTRPADRNKARLLIADDQAELLSLMRDTLELEGFAVQTASNGKEAIDYIRQHPPDAVILDYKMPQMDGFEVCRLVRQDPLLQHLPLIILSATTLPESKVEGLNIGADDYLTKPVNTEELLARVRRLLNRTQQGLDANALTHLPGNTSIETRVDDLLAAKTPLAVLYLDLNQFKAYNDAYGYDAGDRAIKATAQLLIRLTRENPKSRDFVGHIGGDDFIVITVPERMETLAKRALAEFDALAPSFYKEEDRRRGRIFSTDRQGNKREFPLLSLSIGICHNKYRPLDSYAQISEFGAELKKHAKEKPGSAYVLDRRRAD